MKYSFSQRWGWGLGLALLFCTSSMFVSAQSKRMKDAARHSSAAAQVFNQIMGVREKGIPRDLLDRAEAIAVFPGVVKAAFIIGGHGGQGVPLRSTSA